MVLPCRPLTCLTVPTLPAKDCNLGQNDKMLLDYSSFYAIQMHLVLRARSLPGLQGVYGWGPTSVPIRTNHSLSFMYSLSPRDFQP